MADELLANGGGPDVDGPDVDVEIAANNNDSDETTTQTIHKLMQKIQILEQEKKQLTDEKGSAAEKIKQLEDEIASSESDKRALSSIAARAAELETEVSRLQHDLISAMTEGQESSAELTQLKRVVEEVRRSESEKSERFDVVEKERNLLLERLNEASEKLKESESRVYEFERKIEGFEMNESVFKSEKLKFEAKINEKDERIRNLNRTVEELQSVIVKNEADINESKKEKDELEIGNNNLEALLRKSETRVNELESKMDQLQSELESHEKMESVRKEKDVELTNGIVVNGDEKVKSLKPDWPVIAATAGAVAIVAVVCFRHAKF